jgi:hypothetical protein
LSSALYLESHFKTNAVAKEKKLLLVLRMITTTTFGRKEVPHSYGTSNFQNSTLLGEIFGITD